MVESKLKTRASVVILTSMSSPCHTQSTVQSLGKRPQGSSRAAAQQNQPQSTALFDNNPELAAGGLRSTPFIGDSDFALLGRIGEGQFGTASRQSGCANYRLMLSATCLVVSRMRGKRSSRVQRLERIRQAGSTTPHSQQLDLFTERRLHLSASRYAPPLFVAYTSPNAIHLVVEYAPCGTLWDRIATDGALTKRLPDEEVRWWASQMVEAISWVHSQGYAHRDVKPHNCLLYMDGQLKLTDFGSAAPSVGNTVPASHCSLPVGTPDYIAPEVLAYAEANLLVQTPQPYTNLVDWWSLGATIYELITGTPPFFAQSIAATYAKILAIEYRLPKTASDLECLLLE
jgi:serine/threonine protein kinase